METRGREGSNVFGGLSVLDYGSHLKSDGPIADTGAEHQTTRIIRSKPST